MGKPERNEPSRTVKSVTEELRAAIRDAAGTNLMRATPRVQRALAWLEEFARETDARLEALEQAMESGSRPLPRKMREQLYGLLSTGEQLGQIEPAIPDAERPGGPQPGDIIGGPEQVRFGESYGGTD